MDIPPSKIRAVFHYNIDFDDEKEDYNFDENGNCILLNGTAVSWEQVKNEGMDAVSLYYKSKNGKWIKFADDEMD